MITIAGLVRNLRNKLQDSQDENRVPCILDQLVSSSETMERFLTDLLDGMALEGTEPELTLLKMDEIVSEVIREHKHLIDEKGIDVRLDFAAADASLFADKRRIKQVFDNLLTNAMRYMGNVPDPRIWITLQAEHDIVKVAVCDNGVGIAPEYQARIFDQFFRIPNPSAQKGTGLGLSIVKKIVEIHGGKIWCESQEGRGAKFVFTLPKKSPCLTHT